MCLDGRSDFSAPRTRASFKGHVVKNEKTKQQTDFDMEGSKPRRSLASPPGLGYSTFSMSSRYAQEDEPGRLKEPNPMPRTSVPDAPFGPR